MSLNNKKLFVSIVICMSSLVTAILYLMTGVSIISFEFLNHEYGSQSIVVEQWSKVNLLISILGIIGFIIFRNNSRIHNMVVGVVSLLIVILQFVPFILWTLVANLEVSAIIPITIHLFIILLTFWCLIIIRKINKLAN